MKFLSSLTIALSGATIASAVSVPQSLSERSSDVGLTLHEKSSFINNIFEKLRGGGGRSYSSGSSSRGSSSGSSKPAPNSLPSSNRGGRTSDGSGAPKLYGKSSFYGGGAKVPFKAGKKSPSGIQPYFIPRPILLVAFPGAWLYGAYAYDYQITFMNQSAKNPFKQNRDVSCLCQQYQVCGCDDNQNAAYIKDIVGDGNLKKLNHSLVTVGELKGQTRLLLNGTLPNGTTASGWATGNRQSLMEHASWGVVAAVIMYSMWLM
jgi:hypothetical protein